MKYLILFSGKNKKDMSKYHLLKVLPSMLSFTLGWFVVQYSAHAPSPNIIRLETFGDHWSKRDNSVKMNFVFHLFLVEFLPLLHFMCNII